jgi:hypothetical protein
VWLEYYRLACHAGGATDDLFIIKNLPLYLGDSTRTSLEHLPRNKINDWTDLRRVFVGNFQGMYARPGKQWELCNCKQKPKESLREYIHCFSKHCTELPSTMDNDAISTFQNDMTCSSLIHRLGRRTPRTTRDLLDIASNHADGEEAVVATLNTPREREKKSWTMARGLLHISIKRRRATSDGLTTTLSQQLSARRHDPRAARPRLVLRRTISRS